jgi:hypothetical protein
VELLPAIDRGFSSDGTPEKGAVGEIGTHHGIKPARQSRVAAIERLALQSSEFAAWSMTSCSTRRVISGDRYLSVSDAGIGYYDLLASEADCPLSWRSRDNCLRSWFSWDVCSPASVGTDSPFMERFDVRVPHASPGDADLRKHAARPDA